MDLIMLKNIKILVLDYVISDPKTFMNEVSRNSLKHYRRLVILIFISVIHKHACCIHQFLLYV